MKKSIDVSKIAAKIGYILIGMLIMFLIASVSVPVLASQTTKQLNAYFKDIKIVIEDEMITPKDANGRTVEPFIVDGTTYLPVRAICEAIGYEVEWDGATNTVYIYSSVNHAK